jgi:hypothetical protein
VQTRIDLVCVFFFLLSIGAEFVQQGEGRPRGRGFAMRGRACIEFGGLLHARGVSETAGAIKVCKARSLGRQLWPPAGCGPCSHVALAGPLCTQPARAALRPGRAAARRFKRKAACNLDSVLLPRAQNGPSLPLVLTLYQRRPLSGGDPSGGTACAARK